MSRLIPLLFVFLWASGFIGAKYGLPYAEPFTFLFVRLCIVSALLVAIITILKQPWPTSPRLWGHITISGLLVHFGYLGGVFSAISLGMPAGIMGLLAGLQPLLTATIAPSLLGDKVRPLQWMGLTLGFIGVALVLSEKITGQTSGLFDGFGWDAMVFALIAVASITASTLYQKRYCTTMPLLSGTAIQYFGSAMAFGVAAYTTETMQINWTGDFIFALAWLVIILSIGAVMLLMILIKQGESTKVASFFYLVPPMTALQAYLLFDETLGLSALIGFVVVCLGIALTIKQQKP